MSQLKNEFFGETGIEWENSQGEPDIEYVNWLESKVEKFTSTNSKSMPCQCGEPLENHICPSTPQFYRKQCC